MSRTNFDQLLQAGCHFGHLKRKWNPAMAPYIFMERNGIHIIDLNKTVAKIDEAAEALKAIAKSGKKILFVATKKQAKDIVADKAASVNMPYVNERWAQHDYRCSSCRRCCSLCCCSLRIPHQINRILISSKDK